MLGKIALIHYNERRAAGNMNLKAGKSEPFDRSFKCATTGVRACNGASNGVYLSRSTLFMHFIAQFRHRIAASCKGTSRAAKKRHAITISA